jgi:hypothetical protein
MKKKGRGPSKKVYPDTVKLMLAIRIFQDYQRKGYIPEGSAKAKKYIDKLISPALVKHALAYRFDELYRASKKYALVGIAGVPRSQPRREIGMANAKYRMENGRPPTMEEWRKEYLAMRNPGYEIDMKTFRWIAKQTGQPWTRVRKVK